MNTELSARGLGNNEQSISAEVACLCMSGSERPTLPSAECALISGALRSLRSKHLSADPPRGLVSHLSPPETRSGKKGLDRVVRQRWMHVTCVILNFLPATSGRKKKNTGGIHFNNIFYLTEYIQNVVILTDGRDRIFSAGWSHTPTISDGHGLEANAPGFTFWLCC